MDLCSQLETDTGRRERSLDAPLGRHPPVAPTLRICVDDSDDDGDFFGTGGYVMPPQPHEAIDADSKILSWLVDICDRDYRGTTDADIRAMSFAVSMSPANPNSMASKIRELMVRESRLKAERKRLNDQYATKYSHIQQQLEMIDTSLTQLHQAVNDSLKKHVVDKVLEEKENKEKKEKTE